MLVLSRRLGESVVINAGIEVVVLEMRGGTVRLGFNAPVHVAIHRAEVQRRIYAEASHENVDQPGFRRNRQAIDRG